MFAKVAELAHELLKKLILGAVQKRIANASDNFFTRRKIQSRIEDAIATVAEPLVAFFDSEKVDESQQIMLLDLCARELQPLVAEPGELFRGSLDGAKIFAQLYPSARDLPEAVRDERLENVYELLLPRIADFLCRVPVVVGEWEREKWREDYRRLDQIAYELSAVMHKVDTLVTAGDREADALFHRVRRVAAQNARLQLDITGLHAGQVVAGAFDALYVEPDISPEKPHGTLPLWALRLRVVEGAPGAGKSTWSKWLQLRALDANPGDARARPRLPIRMELRSERDEQMPSVHVLIRRAAGAHLAEEITSESTRKWLDAGRVLFILDGFDELAPARRDAVREWMLGLASAIGTCELIVTSRPLSTDHLQNLGDDWTRSRIQEFDEARVVDYIRRWYQHVPLVSDEERAIDAEALAGQWASDPTIGPLTGNPLLLCTLLMVHRLDGGLPRGRAELYRRYVDGMLDLWDSRRQVRASDVPMTRNEKHRVLRELALHMHFAEVDQLDEEPTREVVARALPNHAASPEQMLAILRERSGLLIGPGVYSFVHRSVAEYLVAEAVKEGDQKDPRGTRVDRFQLFQHRHDDRWHTVLYLWAGLAPNRDVEDFVRACLERPTGKDVVLVIGLMEDCIGRLDEQVVRELVLELSRVQVDEISRVRAILLHAAPHAFWSGKLVHMLVLCGLARGTALPSALAVLIRQANLSWDDCSQTRGPLRLLFAYAFWEIRERSWLRAIEDLCRGNQDERAFCALIFTTILNHSSAAERTGFREVVRTHLPELIAGDLFIMMGSVISYCCLIEDIPAPFAASLKRLLVFLARTDVRSFDPTWLRWSHQWMSLPSPFTRKRAFDLLQEFEDVLPEIIARIEDLDPEVIERVTALVQAMKQQRAALPPG